MRALALAMVAAAAPAAATKYDDLQGALQTMLDGLTAAHPTFSVQLGWKSREAEFSLASGTVRRPGAAPRKVTTDDTFLFGSGTKSFTSAAVMKLVERGVVSLDDKAETHIDSVLDQLKPGASLQGLFGVNATHITVGHVLRMQSGVQDFDFAPFDNYLLQPNETYKTHSPFEFVEYASKQTPKLLCFPGTCVSYSSNNFVLAGFILLKHAPGVSWPGLELRSFFSDDQKKSFGDAFFFSDQLLDAREYLTVPGATGGGWAKLPNTTIWNQSSTILGWTCGNMAATTKDVAGFIWDLLGPDNSLLSAPTLAEMTKFKPLDLGWAAGYISYGAGLMIESSSLTTKHPPTFTEWGTYMGHGGDTYGFLSEQGMVWGLNASVSIVSNQDGDGQFVSMDAMCKTIQTGAKVLAGVELDLKCMN